MEIKKAYLKTRALTIRDGVEITAPQLNEAVLRDHFRGAKLLFTVVGQSLPENSTVPKGTTVDVTMAHAGELPVNIIQYAHPAFEGHTVEQVARKTREDPRLLKVISDNKTTRTLSDSDRKTLVEFSRKAGVQIDPDDKEAVDSVFETARGAFVLAGPLA